MDLPGPWSLLRAWPAGCSVVISGGPGVGKSSLCSLFLETWPMVWLTSEQSGQQAGGMFRRLYPAIDPPEIVVVRTPKQAMAVLDTIEAGLVVLDSITSIAGWDAQLGLLERVDEWLLESGDRRFLVVQQHNGRGEAAGQMGIAHLVDACCDVDDDHGYSRVNCWKNRNGPIGSRCFELGAGRPTVPDFPFAYSVEGARGRYFLLPYPMGGGKYDGYLRALMAQAERTGEQVGNVATAAVPVRGYPRGLFFPADVDARRRFAEEHGLIWMPRDGAEWMPRTEEREQ